MAHFEATVRVFDVIEPNAPAARRVVEERLRAAGFTRWQIVGVGLQGAISHGMARPRRAVRNGDLTYAGGGLLIFAVVAWTFWFLWLLAG